MRAPALVTLAAILAVGLGSRSARADEAQAREAFLDQRRALMIGLTAWSGISIAAGGALLALDVPRVDDKRSFRRALGAVTLAYGLINAGIAGGTLAGLPAERDSLARLHGIGGTRYRDANVFAANAGLDMLYVTVGAALWWKGPTAAARGAGMGFFTQGGALVFFDSLGTVVYRYAW